MKIVNNTNLPYRVIGEMIDMIQEKNSGDTHYYGKIEHCVMSYKGKEVKIQIRYLKRYVEWRFYEGNRFA